MFPYNAYAQKQRRKKNQAFKDRQNKKDYCNATKQKENKRERERGVCVCVYNMMKCNNKQNAKKKKKKREKSCLVYVCVCVCFYLENFISSFVRFESMTVWAGCVVLGKIIQEWIGEEISSSSSDCIDGEQLSCCSSSS